MEKKSIISVLIALVFGVCFAGFLQSCKTKTMAMYIAKPTIINNYLHDTVKVAPKELTEEQRQSLIDKFYKYGYDKYYGPKFEELENIIANQAKSNIKQAESISLLANTLKEMRSRSIHYRDSMQIVDSKLRHDLLLEQTIAANAEKKQVFQNISQINQLKRITNFLIWGFISLWVGTPIIFYIFYLWVKNRTSIKR